MISSGLSGSLLVLVVSFEQAHLGQEIVPLVDPLLLVEELNAPLLHDLLQPRQALALQHHPLVDLFCDIHDCFTTAHEEAYR